MIRSESRNYKLGHLDKHCLEISVLIEAGQMNERTKLHIGAVQRHKNMETVPNPPTPLWSFPSF